MFDRRQLAQEACIVQQSVESLIARLDGREQRVVIACHRIFQIELHDRRPILAVRATDPRMDFVQLAPVEHYDVPTWCRVLQVNVTAAFVLTQILLPLLKRSADGAIVFTASGVGRIGRAYWGAYAVSKFAIEGLNEVLAAELSGITPVRVNSLNPGATRTKMRRQAYPAEDPESLPAPEQITHAYLALLGPASRGITGGRFNAQKS